MKTTHANRNIADHCPNEVGELSILQTPQQPFGTVERPLRLSNSCDEL
jgi:hypothetical protein